MTLEEAKVIAEKAADREYVSGPRATESEYVVDGSFSADELEALAICLRAGVAIAR